MARRPDPDRIYIARRIAVLNRLIDEARITP
jgi:hypothetical protein